MNETALAAEQVHEIVEQLRTANYTQVGQKFFDQRVSQITNAGWVLGIEAFRVLEHKGRRGHLLNRPRYQWRNIAFFYHQPSQVNVFYWDNSAPSMVYAKDLAAKNPPPAGHYVTFNKQVNARWNTTKP